MFEFEKEQFAGELREIISQLEEWKERLDGYVDDSHAIERPIFWTKVDVSGALKTLHEAKRDLANVPVLPE